MFNHQERKESCLRNKTKRGVAYFFEINNSGLRLLGKMIYFKQEVIL